MNAFDRAMQSGSSFRIAMSILLVLLFTVLGFADPQHRYYSMLMVMIGLGGLVRELRHRRGENAPMHS